MEMNYLEKQINLNKIAFVIGGLGTIGLEVSKALLDSGAQVVIIDVKTLDKKLKTFVKKNNFKYYQLNKNWEKYLSKDFKKIVRKFSTPDIFVNCSYPKTNKWKFNTFEKLKLSELTKNIKLHLVSFCWFAKLAADEMKKNKKKGTIIQLGSIYGLKAQDMSLYKNTKIKENASYSIIKGGIINFSKQMASYYGKYAIRINNVCPGGVRNPKDNNQKNLNFMKRYNLKTPLKKMAESSDVASAVLFLSSNSSSHITGQTLVVDGGLSIV